MFLRCNNCGHYNDVKSEYMTFCSACGKKLNNSYSEWKKNNSEKTFEDYLKEVCYDRKEEIKPKKSTKLKYIYIIIPVIIIIFILGGIFVLKPAYYSLKNKAYNKVIVETVNEINSSCPVMIDSETRLDNVVFSGNEFQYNFTLVNIDKDNADIELLKSYLESQIKSLIKTNPDMKELKERLITIKYNIYDKSGENMFSVEITPQDI